MATNEIGILKVILESIFRMTNKNILQQHCVTLGWIGGNQFFLVQRQKHIDQIY